METELRNCDDRRKHVEHKECLGRKLTQLVAFFLLYGSLLPNYRCMKDQLPCTCQQYLLFSQVDDKEKP
jgi:hypothetical protein